MYTILVSTMLLAPYCQCGPACSCGDGPACQCVSATVVSAVSLPSIADAIKRAVREHRDCVIWVGQDRPYCVAELDDCVHGYAAEINEHAGPGVMVGRYAGGAIDDWYWRAGDADADVVTRLRRGAVTETQTGLGASASPAYYLPMMSPMMMGGCGVGGCCGGGCR